MNYSTSRDDSAFKDDVCPADKNFRFFKCDVLTKYHCKPHKKYLQYIQVIIFGRLHKNGIRY